MLYIHALVRTGWMNGLQFYDLFNSISVILGRWMGDNEGLCAMESRFRLKIFSPQERLIHGSARSVDKRLTILATGAPVRTGNVWKRFCTFSHIRNIFIFFSNTKLQSTLDFVDKSSHVYILKTSSLLICFAL